MKESSTPSKTLGLVGREDEILSIRTCLAAGRNVLLEGPVGVGKTQLALAVTRELGRPVFRIDGDSRYSEQKLSGWFDPPLVIQKGFNAETFIAGPLVEAMKTGGVLFINELNRLPEGVQNILLPAIDERILMIPRLGMIKAQPGFAVIATQNPKEFVATTHLSEAILDRFEWVMVNYQSEEEEGLIVSSQCWALQKLEKPTASRLSQAAVRLVRATRAHPGIRRGASVRAAQAIADLAATWLHEGKQEFTEAFVRAALLALPTRIELERDVENEGSAQEAMTRLVRELAENALADGQKKKR